MSQGINKKTQKVFDFLANFQYDFQGKSTSPTVVPIHFNEFRYFKNQNVTLNYLKMQNKFLTNFCNSSNSIFAIRTVR